MSDADWRSRPHRRRNALTGEWILVSPQRTQRPWQGESTAPARETTLRYDPACYLCPGNERAGGERNPAYDETFVFDNDYAALLPDVAEGGQGFDRAGTVERDVGPGDASRAKRESAGDDLLVARTERGRCRVVCFSPRHDLSVSQMSIPEIRAVIDAWADEYARLGAEPEIASVVIFENRGGAMGASNPHPHSQIWATQTIPNEPAKERAASAAYAATHGGACVLCDYVARELALGERIVYANDGAVVLVPFWAVWPFETLVVPRRHAGSLADLAPGERDALADAMGVLTRAYDRVFDVAFPYSMGFHQQPTETIAGAPAPGNASTDRSGVHAHAHYLPPLLRSASVRKYMVGFELLGMPQRDITPETAAERLQQLLSPP